MIKLQLKHDSCSPGETIEGQVAWANENESTHIEIRLLWFTVGKGDRDLSIVDSTRIDLAGDGTYSFRFQTPFHPYSFSGKLISLVWTVEAVIFPSRDAEKVDFVLGPSREEILLRSIDTA